jgi:hypothetical protein
MKKVMFTSVIAVLFLTAFSSCRKCQICTKDSSPEIRVCEKDYGTSTEYGFTIDTYQAGGYDCR